MSINADVQSLSPGKLISLYELDLSPITKTDTVSDHLYFVPSTNELSAPVVWQAKTYNPFPIKVEGYEKTTKGSLPRPTLTVSNVTGILWPTLAQYDDLVGARVIRRQTYVKYLDAVNFSGGNPTADPTASLPDEVHFVERKTTADHEIVVFELASAMDLAGVKLPGRDVTVDVCPWVYRGPDCGYAGTNYFDATGSPVASLALDVCSKSLRTGCKKRFPSGPVPFGGFPAARAYKL